MKIINLKETRHEREVASNMSDGKAQGLQWSRYVVFLYRPAGSMGICIKRGYLFIERFIHKPCGFFTQSYPHSSSNPDSSPYHPNEKETPAM